MALMLPAFLLIVMIGLDFGRFFQGWVHIQQAARVGANYASTHSKDIKDPTKHDLTMAALTTLVTSDASTSDCSDTPAVSEPEFLTIADTGRELESVKVAVSCTFTLVSPLGALLELAAGNSSQSPTLQVGADSVFPIRDLYASDIADAQSGTPLPPPTASWYSQCFPSIGTNPLTISCQGGWSGSAASWSWTWGDGGSATGCQNIAPTTDGYCTATHTYTSAGTFTVTFTVTNGSGSGSITKVITVNSAAPDPVAHITCISPTTCSSTSLSVVVTLSSATSTSSYLPLTCSWNPGTGSTVSGCGTQSWIISGTCTASLTVTNTNNSSDTTTKTITVGNPPAGTCSATPISAATPTPGPTGTPPPIATTLTYTSPTCTKINTSTALVAHLKVTSSGAPVSAQWIYFGVTKTSGQTTTTLVDISTAKAQTNGSGDATYTFTPSQSGSNWTVTVNFPAPLGSVYGSSGPVTASLDIKTANQSC
jgi:hypothetical protein